MSRASVTTALAVVLALLGWALRGTGLELTVFHAINAWGPQAPVFWSSWSVVGLGVSVLLILAAGGAARAQALVTWVLVLVLGGLVLHAAKLGIGALRPLAVLGPDGVQVVGAALLRGSMPSGHSATGFALAALATHFRFKGAWVYWLGALMVGLSRMAVGAHWPSDVLVGAGLGLVLGLAGARWPWAVRTAQACAVQMQSRAGSRLVAGALVMLASGFWVADYDYPAATTTHAGLCLLGLWAALVWWWAHPSHHLKSSDHARGSA